MKNIVFETFSAQLQIFNSTLVRTRNITSSSIRHTYLESNAASALSTNPFEDVIDSIMFDTMWKGDREEVTWNATWDSTPEFTESNEH